MLPYAERMRRRAAVVGAVRRFFDARGFVEVDTTLAQSTLAPEPHLEAPAVTLNAGGRRHARYLQTSPELLMKRVLALGLDRIYQIAPAFRDGDFTPLHRPEFRIVEWYRKDSDWTALMDDCEGLLRAAAAAAGLGDGFRHGEREVTLGPPFRRVSVDEAFRAHAGFSILEALARPALERALARLGIHFAADDSWDDLFHRVFLSRVEPKLLDDSRPLFLTHYPAPLAALARLSPEDPRTAERFELYAGGLELANAYGELVDADEQRRRFAIDGARRRAQNLHDYPLDERFFQALATLPPSAGIALGLDRLLMLLLDAQDIDGVAFIPWSES